MTVMDIPNVDLRNTDRFYIGGEWVRPSSASTIDVICPFTEDVFFSVAEAQAADVDRAVTAAREAFDHGPWPRMTHAERAGYMLAMADELVKAGQKISAVWVGEIGVLARSAAASEPTRGNPYKYYASLAEDYDFVTRHKPTAGGHAGFLAREPVGVVAAIIPWNGPISLITQKSAPALLAGCTVIVKSSPEAPGESYLMAEIAERVGLPPGVLNFITADREVSELLVSDPRVDKITFTGSTAAGRRIASVAGNRIARVTLELGGKSAAVILDDMDLAEAAALIAGPACGLNGQVCSSLTRIVVQKDRHDEFLDALSAAFGSMQVGNPYDPSSRIGPLAMRRQRDRVEGYIAKGIESGATLATGGRRPAHLDKGFYIEPTVFGNVANSSVIAQEEIFGPVLSVIPAENEQDAINIANDTIFGLNASVFTKDADRAYQVARQLRSGTVGHNSWRTDFGIAFGGFKQSGLGREGGREGLLPFLEMKTIILNEEPTLAELKDLPIIPG
jgi:aldehyde dehydrogenase (NAD+)